MLLPESFRQTIIETFTNGPEWLDDLPNLITQMADRWSLSVGPPFENLSYYYVASATLADGAEVVLKLGPPNPELSTEIEALRLYDGNGSARLLQADPEAGALLTERLRPGEMLATLEDERAATSIATDIMRRLWRPLSPGHAFPDLSRWFQALTEHRAKFNGGTGPIPSRLFDEAESLFNDLIASQGEPVLLHGNIHHFNILTAQRVPWLAIDPKGIVGEREFDTSQFMLNPWPKLLERPNPRQVLSGRIGQFSDQLGFDRARIRGWGICNAVLSACWDADKPWISHRYDLRCAELLSAIKV